MSGGAFDSQVTTSRSRKKSRTRVDECALSVLRRKMEEAAKLSGWENPPMVVISDAERKVGKTSDEATFTRWLANHPYLADFIGGDIVIRELPYVPHSAAQAEVSGQFGAQRGGLLGTATAANVLGRISGDTLVPDIVITVLGASNKPGVVDYGVGQYAAIILEIASSQTPFNLHARASFYLGPECPTCEYYIGIKRYDHRRSDQSQAMVAAVYDRMVGGNPIDIISFGTGPLWHNASWVRNPIQHGVGVGGPACNAPGIEFYTINLASARVFATRAVGLPVGAPLVYTLDLFPIQQQLALPFSSL